MSATPEIVQWLTHSLGIQARREDYQQMVDMMHNLVHSISTRPAGDVLQETEQLSVLLKSFCAVSSQINEYRHESLLKTVYAIDVWKASQVVRSAWLELLQHLVTVKATFLQPCIDHLVKSFVPVIPVTPPKPPVQNTLYTPTPLAVEVHSAVTTCLAQLMAHIPRSSPLIKKAIATRIPHKLQSREVQCTYLHATYLLMSSSAGETIRGPLLGDIVDHLVSMDVEIKWEDIVDQLTGQEEEEGSSDDEEDDIFGMEDGTQAHPPKDETLLVEQAKPIPKVASGGASGWEGMARSGPQTNASASQAPAQRILTPSAQNSLSMAEKLDSLMAMTLEYIQTRATASPAQMQRLWEAVLNAFQTSILLTHRAKFTPYIVFAVAMHTNDGGADFVQLLISRICDTAQPSIARTTCAAYCASFLARSAFTTTAVVLAALKSLCEFASQYSASHTHRTNLGSSTARAPSSQFNALTIAPPKPWTTIGSMPRRATMSSLPDCVNTGLPDEWMRHEVFYAVCQVVLYVLCYHVSTTDRSAPHQEAFLALITNQIIPVLNCPLQPLHVCLPTVVREFAKQMDTLKLSGIEHLLPSDENQSRARRPLEMFFPYDPYLLPLSVKHLSIDTTYRVWRYGHAVPNVAAADEDDEEVDNSDDSASSDDSDNELNSQASPRAGTSVPRCHINPFTNGVQVPMGPAYMFRGSGYNANSASEACCLNSFSSANDLGMSPDALQFDLGVAGTSPGGAGGMSCTPDMQRSFWAQQMQRRV